MSKKPYESITRTRKTFIRRLQNETGMNLLRKTSCWITNERTELSKVGDRKRIAQRPPFMRLGESPSEKSNLGHDLQNGGWTGAGRIYTGAQEAQTVNEPSVRTGNCCWVWRPVQTEAENAHMRKNEKHDQAGVYRWYAFTGNENFMCKMEAWRQRLGAPWRAMRQDLRTERKIKPAVAETEPQAADTTQNRSWNRKMDRQTGTGSRTLRMSGS
jgi:hypothetical protein